MLSTGCLDALTASPRSLDSVKPPKPPLPAPNPAGSPPPGVRLVIQRVNSAKLLIDNVDQWESIGTGFVGHICFLKGASADLVPKIVSTVLTAKIAGDRASIAAKTLDFMLIPQASMAGKLKRGQVQYHSLYPKEAGKELFTELCRAFATAMPPEAKFVHGTYSNRQALKFDSPGPYSHFLEL